MKGGVEKNYVKSEINDFHLVKRTRNNWKNPYIQNVLILVRPRERINPFIKSQASNYTHSNNEYNSTRVQSNT